MEKSISLYELAFISYNRDIECNSYRLKLCESEDGNGYSEIKYRGYFNRKVKPIIQKYKVDKIKGDDLDRYLIPEKDIDTIINIYDLLDKAYPTIRKIANKKYVSAKELKSEIDTLNMKEENKVQILNFFEYDVRERIDCLKNNILMSMNESLDYILMPYNDGASETKDPKLLDRDDKKKNKEEKLSIQDKLEIIEYINEKYNEFNYNVLCLTNDIAMTRKEESIESKEPIQEMIKRLSYWE